MRSSGVNCSKWEDDEAVVVSPLSTTCVLLLPPIRSPKCVDILGVAVVWSDGYFCDKLVERIGQNCAEQGRDQSSEIESL